MTLLANGIIGLTVFILLFLAELLYFKLADRFNIIDKPNERSSHSKIVLRGGGIIYVIGALLWVLASLVCGKGELLATAWPFLLGLVMVALVSFVDDIHSLPDSVRLVVQFTAMLLMFKSLGILQIELWWVVIIGLIVCVGITNVYNFMDGINGITGGYSLAVLIPLLLLARKAGADSSFVLVTILADLVFCFFNFRPKNKAKCFAGDVGSISIAFIVLFVLGNIIVATQDLTYLVFLIVYGVDACLTIVHRIMLHENLGVAHRKHVYQIMANELGMSHIVVSLIYMGLQLGISLAFIFVIPNTPLAHWLYLLAVGILLSVVYVLFMKKFFHLHQSVYGSR